MTHDLCFQTWKKVKEQRSVVWMCSTKMDMSSIYRGQGLRDCDLGLEFEALNSLA